jgi:adenylate cyclase
MASLWRELKRRNVVRVGVAYLAGSWLSLQVADIVLPNLDSPPWIMIVLIYSAAIGFPFALIVAWYYELTPEGIKSAADAGNTAPVGFTGRKIDFAIIGILILAIGFLLVGRETPVIDDDVLSKSIAVLPFANLSGDPDQDYFAAGITEDIITDLSRFGLFFVISRNSTFAYTGTTVNAKDVARELGVQYVLEGSVQKSGDRIRITGQLIDAIEDKHIWAERYDRKIEDIFEIQDEISQSIVASVAPEYLSAEMKRAQRKETRNLDAWDSFIRGYWHHMRFTRDDNATAQELVREAIELDPNQANYHGLLAVTYTLEAFYGWSESREQSFRKALESAERGLALDDQDALVIRSAGIVHFFMKNHDTALDYFKRSVQANPYEAESRALFGAALGVAGDYDAALHQFESAMRMSPRDLHIATWYSYLGIAAFVAGRHEEAAEWSIKATQSNPQLPGGLRTLASSYGNLGRLKDAAAAREKLQDLQPNVTIAQLRESLPYFKNPEDLERYLEGLRKAGLPE